VVGVVDWGGGVGGGGGGGEEGGGGGGGGQRWDSFRRTVVRVPRRANNSWQRGTGWYVYEIGVVPVLMCCACGGVACVCLCLCWRARSVFLGFK